MSSLITIKFPGSRTLGAPSVQSYKPKKAQPKQQQANNNKPKPKVDDFPSLPSSSNWTPVAPKTSVKPVIKTTAKPQTQVKKSSPVKETKNKKFVDSDEDDYPSLSAGPSINLNNFSRKTVQSSGQDLSYSASQLSSNIRTIDRSVLEQSKSTSSGSSAKPSVNSESDFPELSRPQQLLDFAVTSSKKSNKNKNKNNNNSSNANKVKSQNNQSGTSLNSICDSLGGGAPVKSKPRPEEKVKPIESKKVAEEEVFRPSKTKAANINNNNVAQVKKKSPEASEDFPMLQSKGKLSRTFVSSDEKLVQQKSVFNQWSKNVNQVENSLQNTHISNKIDQPKAKGPPGLNKKPNSYKYSAPNDFQQRNAGLITTITDLIGGRSLEFKTFKEISGKFRGGKMKSGAYFTECKQLMNKDQFNQVFPELLSLLPDISKQQELYKLYKSDSWYDSSAVNECDICLQINLSQDDNRHRESHYIDEDFPQL